MITELPQIPWSCDPRAAMIRIAVRGIRFRAVDAVADLEETIDLHCINAEDLQIDIDLEQVLDLDTERFLIPDPTLLDLVESDPQLPDLGGRQMVDLDPLNCLGAQLDRRLEPGVPVNDLTVFGSGDRDNVSEGLDRSQDPPGLRLVGAPHPPRGPFQVRNRLLHQPYSWKRIAPPRRCRWPLGTVLSAPIRTSLWKANVAFDYAAPRARRSVRAAARLSLKLSRE